MTNIYTDLPATLRGSNLESHTGWPRTWTTTDTDDAVNVAAALADIIRTGGVPLNVHVTATDTDVTITVDRHR